MKSEPKSSPSKPFEEMTEEEKIEWAKTYEWKSRKVIKANVQTTFLVKNAKNRLDNSERQRKKYRDPEFKKRVFGDAYNERIRLLYQHNEEFRELKKYRVAYRLFRKKRYSYEAWIHKYYTQYKDKMLDHASIFKLEGQEQFLNGFTISDLAKFSPASKSLLLHFLKDNLFPKPAYRGYKYKGTKRSEEVEEFYLVSEVEAFMNVFAKYKKKYSLVNTKEQKAYLKKQFWQEMIKAREEFNGRS